MGQILKINTLGKTYFGNVKFPKFTNPRNRMRVHHRPNYYSVQAEAIRLDTDRDPGVTKTGV